MEALVEEVAREKVHPPTLRRLLRCVLETEVVVGGGDWELALRVLERAEEREVDTIGGGVCELMGRVIGVTGGEGSEQGEVFMDLCERASHSLVGWRVRYAVAEGIGRSGLLALGAAGGFARLWLVALKLLQDDDCDVRESASATVGGGGGEGLEGGYARLCEVGGVGVLVKEVIERELLWGSGAKEAFLRFAGEGEERGVFEDEEVNEYFERVKNLQVACKVVRESGGVAEGGNLGERARGLEEEMRQVMGERSSAVVRGVMEERKVSERCKVLEIIGETF